MTEKKKSASLVSPDATLAVGRHFHRSLNLWFANHAAASVTFSLPGVPLLVGLRCRPLHQKVLQHVRVHPTLCEGFERGELPRAFNRSRLEVNESCPAAHARLAHGPLRIFFRRYDSTIPHMNDAVAISCSLGIVGDHQHGLP